MATLRPPLRADEFDGGSRLTRENGRRDLRDTLTRLDAAATFLGQRTTTAGALQRPVTLAQWRAVRDPLTNEGFTALPGAGEVCIWNTTEGRMQWWNGTAWVNAMGVLD